MIKNIYKLMLVIISLLSTVIITISVDKSQQEKYLLLDLGTYNEEIGILNYDNIDIVSELPYLNELALKYNVKLLISQSGYNGSTIYNLVSSNSEDYLNEQLNLKPQAKLPYTTIGNQANVSDILGNDSFIYNTFLNCKDRSFYWDGQISIGYQNKDQYDQFLNEYKKHFNVDENQLLFSNRQYRQTNQLMVLSLLGCLIISSVLFILLVIQKIVNNSSKIGVLLLLGFNNNRIFKKLFIKDLVYILIAYILFLFSCLFLKDIPVTLYKVILVKDITLACIVFLIYCLFLKRIINKKTTANIIKKQNVASSLRYFSLFVQLGVTIVILFISLYGSSVMVDIINTNKKYQEFAYINNYGVIRSINTDFLLNNNDKAQAIFSEIRSNDILKSKYMYAFFDKYIDSLDEGVMILNDQRDDSFATVSLNYLTSEGITILDKNNQPFDLTTLKGNEDIFIFPINYQKDYHKVIDTYYSNSDYFYKENNLKFNPTILYYKNKVVRTYNPIIKEIDSPVFKLVRNDDNRNYFGEYEGLSLYGIGLITGLKFLVEDDKDVVLKELNNIFKSNGLASELTGNNFITYSEFFGEEMSRNMNAAKILFTSGLVMTLVFVVAQFQFIYMYISQNSRKITIKKFLGHKFTSIYKTLLIISLGSFVVCFTTVFIGGYLLNLGNLLIYSLFSLFLFLLFVLILFVMIMIVSQNLTSKSLKGGNE